MENLVDRVYYTLQNYDIKRDIPLSDLTSFRIGGPAALVFRPHSADDLAKALMLCNKVQFPYHVLGNGTNVLAPDAGFPGMIIRIDTPIIAPYFYKNAVTCDAGTSITLLAQASVRQGLMGLESMCGIPGTVGGACAMNAGAYGAEIRHVIAGVRIFRDGKVEDVKTKRTDFGNRTSRFCAPDAIVLTATFQLKPDDGTAKAHMEEVIRARKEKQPLSFPSAGSVFKRPAGRFAGALIEQCNLKGISVGGAQVSEKHAGFIINRGGATEHDVLELIQLIQTRVFEATGVLLEREVRLLAEV